MGTNDGARGHGRETAAIKLLRKALASGLFTPDAIARALVISDSAMERYLSGAEPMPADRQLCLALFVIECIPALARAGHQLRGQVAAAMAYQSGVTESHGHSPPPRSWPKRE